MTDEPAFLRAAQAQPDDDTLRLVYADWLEEQGRDTQAAFVRLQVERSRRDVFDPDRAALLRDEAWQLQKHKRYWNGGVHRDLHARGLRGLIDARRGAIRGWDYHRGMVGRVSITADGLAEHPDVVSALGPVRALEIVGWRDWSTDEMAALHPLFAGLKVVALRRYLLPFGSHYGVRQDAALAAIIAFTPLHRATVLDLRSVEFAAGMARDLAAAARAGTLPPVVLFRRTVYDPPPSIAAARRDAHQRAHVLDPHRRWDALRPWFADFTGELLDPIRA